MTSGPESSSGDGSTQPQAPATHPRWWLAVIIFVGGLAVGALTVSLLFASTPDMGPDAESPDSGPGQAGPSDDGPVPVVAEARVNAACLRVLNEAQDVSRILSGLDKAASDVDLQSLDDIVRRLQPIEPRLAKALQECRVDTEVVGDPSAAPRSPLQPLPSSTPSPTR